MFLPWTSEDARLARFTRRAQQGDSDAFRSLYRALYSRVARFVGRRVASQPDVEDIVGRVFERFVERLDDIDPKRVSAFVLTMARNSVFDFTRTRHPGEPMDAAKGLASDKADPLGKLISGEELKAVAVALDRLSDDDRELVSLRFGDGLRHREIAELLGLTEDAVKQRFSRALRTLRDTLHSEDLGGLAHEDAK
jgi:RNA polymerase sigma-70 factor, ECF subfamily